MLQQSITCQADEVMAYDSDLDDTHESDMHLSSPDVTKSNNLTKQKSVHSDSDLKSDDDLDLLPVTSLLRMIMESDENIVISKNGYRKLDTLCNTQQGQLMLAEIQRSTKQNQLYGNIGSKVVIKRVNKDLNDQKIVKQDDGMIYCTTKSVLKEAMILKHLTVDNHPIGQYIVQFADFFESDSHYYLCMEYVDGMNLKQFIETAQQYIKQNKLEIKHYHRAVKFILWQLIASLRALHDVYHCMYRIHIQYITIIDTYLNY